MLLLVFIRHWPKSRSYSSHWKDVRRFLQLVGGLIITEKFHATKDCSLTGQFVIFLKLLFHEV